MAKTKYIQHILEHASKYVGLPIKYEKSGESNFRSREMSEAFDALEKAMIIHRVFASTSRQKPLVSNLKISKTSASRYRIGQLSGGSEDGHCYDGRCERRLFRSVGEQIAGQTLLAMNMRKQTNLHYWRREQKGSTSEVDYLMAINDRLIPVEVKSGKTGTLCSLHNFMEESESDLAIRIFR